MEIGVAETFPGREGTLDASLEEHGGLLAAGLGDLGGLILFSVGLTYIHRLAFEVK